MYFAREVSQQPARRRRKAGKGGHHTLAALLWHSKAPREWWALLRNPIFSLSSGKVTPGWYSPSCAEAGRCTWGQDEAVQRELEPTRVNSLEVSRFGVLVSAKCYCEILIYIYIYITYIAYCYMRTSRFDQQDLDFSNLDCRNY